MLPSILSVAAASLACALMLGLFARGVRQLSIVAVAVPFILDNILPAANQSPGVGYSPSTLGTSGLALIILYSYLYHFEKRQLPLLVWFLIWLTFTLAYSGLLFTATAPQLPLAIFVCAAPPIFVVLIWKCVGKNRG